MGQDKKAYTLKYHRLVPADLEALDTFWQQQLLVAIEDKLVTPPDLFGKPLRHSLKGCRTRRVGDYRIVFRVEHRTVRILAVVHRSTKYKGVEGRI